MQKRPEHDVLEKANDAFSRLKWALAILGVMSLLLTGGALMLSQGGGPDTPTVTNQCAASQCPAAHFDEARSKQSCGHADCDCANCSEDCVHT